jgi:nitrogen-specific signal transduction histidine kinase
VSEQEDYINMIRAENDRLKGEVDRLEDDNTWLRGELSQKESVLGEYERGC